MISQILIDFATETLSAAGSVGADQTTLALSPSASLNTITLNGVAHVAVNASARDGDGAALLAELSQLGLQQGAAYSDVVSGYLPANAIFNLTSLVELARIDASYQTAHAGSVNTQDDVALQSALARAAFGVDGTGVTIGIISDSFDVSQTVSTTYADDIASGDLPAGITILTEGSAFSGIDEGRGMAQLIHDIAPGADLMFASAGAGEANFASAIDALVAQGADIIVDDILFFAEPRYQDGIIAQAATNAVAAGVPFFSAIGNQGVAGYQAPFRDAGELGLSGGTLHDWDPSAGVDTALSMVIPEGDTFLAYLHWVDPYLSGTGGASSGALTNIDLHVTEADGTYIGSFLFDETGDDPFMRIEMTNLGPTDAPINLVLERTSGPVPAEISITSFSAPNPDLGVDYQIEYADEFRGVSTYGHSTSANVIGVGASRFDLTPAFGAVSGTAWPEVFTSLGGVTFYFDDTGTALPAPIVRDDVDITASDRGNTTFFGADSTFLPELYPGGDPDPDSFPNFGGTSAAAPNAAAIAALMLEANPSLTPADIEDILQATAQDIDLPLDLAPDGFTIDPLFSELISFGVGPGNDARTGFGLINAHTAVAHALAGQPVALFSDDSFTSLISGYATLTDALAAASAGQAIDILRSSDIGDVGPVTLTVDDLTIRGDLPFDAEFTLAPGTFDLTLLGQTGADLAGNALLNTVNGSRGDNVILGGGGTDLIAGDLGRDTLDGGPGADTIMGGSGADSLLGGGGNDLLEGGAQADTLKGGSNNDFLDGGSNDDRLFGEIGQDTLIGGDGDDYLAGGNAIDALFGDNGADTLLGQGSSDTLSGGDGDDSLDGGASADELYGDFGNDTLLGGAFNDLLFGGFGDDFLDGGTGLDTLFGEGGNDTLIGGSRVDQLDGGSGDDLLDGGMAADNLTGGTGADTLLGGSANDTLDGGAGADELFGGSGSDVLIVRAGEGGDTLSGEAGADRFDFETGFGTASILDFGSTDVIDLLDVAAVTSFSDLVISYGADATVDLGGGDVIDLVGITGGLMSNDFII